MHITVHLRQIGLGKTHLLLAIKNELAEKSPEIKVKYANSQAYLDDLMTEFDRQKKSNAPHHAGVPRRGRAHHR